MQVKKDLYYTKDHEWVSVEGNLATIGISDYAQHSLGDIVYVELPEVDEAFDAGDEFAVIESVKAASDAYMPVAGKVVEVNEALEDEPALLNEDAYANWCEEEE
ncbi:MAG: glycine cleavage system protein H [Clostridiales bacterium]|nr:MAG: glycine cleavage system protein H [Clostridiales bacterium]